MREPEELGRRLAAFASALPSLCARLQGDALVDAVHRLYEELLCAVPRDSLDVAHDAMHLLMCRHGLIGRRTAGRAA